MLSELLVGRATAPSSTLTQVTMLTGNSSQVRDFKNGRARIVDAWYKTQNSAGGNFRIRSTKTEPIQGIRGFALQNNPLPQLPYSNPQPVYANDQLTLEVSGSATGGDFEFLGAIVAYDQLTGVEQPNMMSVAQIQQLRRNNPTLIVQTLEITLSLGTGGDYSGETALSNATHALFNNTKYAVLGYTCSAVCAAVRLRSTTDFGPLGIGGPGTTRGDITKDYFMNLNMQFGIGIPVFNTINLPQILIDGVQDEVGTDVTVTFFVVNLEA